MKMMKTVMVMVMMPMVMKKRTGSLTPQVMRKRWEGRVTSRIFSLRSSSWAGVSGGAEARFGPATPASSEGGSNGLCSTWGGGETARHRPALRPPSSA
jgi:hypothetical protein